MRSTIILLLLFSFHFMAGQCPASNVLWKRIVYLRDSSGQPLSKQLEELEPYLKNVNDCPYKNDSTHALLLQRIGAIHLLQKDFVKAIAYTRQSIDLVYRYAGTPGIKQSHVIKTYNNLRICYDSL